MPKSVKRIVKNSFFQTFGSLCITGCNFLLMLGYAHFLGPENLGSLVTSQAQVLIWTMLVELGLSHSLIGALTSAEGGRTELSRQGFRARDLLFRVLLLRLGGAFLGTGFLFFMASAHAAGDEHQFWQDMAFTPHLFALAFQQTAVSFALYRNRQGLAVAAQVAAVLITVVLSLWLAWKGAPITWLLLAQCWGGFLSGGFLFGYFFLLSARKKKRGNSRRFERSRTGPWGKEAWIALARDAWPYAIITGVIVLWQRLDQLAASHMLGFEQGGQYALAVRMVAVPILLAQAVSLALFPDLQRVGRDSPARMQPVLGAATKAIWRYGVVLIALILILLALVVQPLVPKFRSAIDLLLYFVPGVWAFWMQSFLYNALLGVRRYRLVVEAHLFSLAVYIPSLLFLTWAFALQGVVWSFNLFCIAMAWSGFRAARKAGLLKPGFSLFGPFSAEERALWAGVRLPFRRKR
jgi:O-antigen/teichoic acid export membrane protein